MRCRRLAASFMILKPQWLELENRAEHHFRKCNSKLRHVSSKSIAKILRQSSLNLGGQNVFQGALDVSVRLSFMMQSLRVFIARV